MSEWFKNLKKWQRGALIGCAVGFVIVCLIVYVLQASNLVSYIVKLFMLLLHYWLALPSFWLWDHGYMSYMGSWVLLGAMLVVFYGGFGAIVGRIQQMTSRAWKWRLTGLLALCLIVFYGSSLLVGSSQAHF